MRFRLTQRSIILDDHEVPILLEFHGISYIWVPATATRNPCSRLAVVGVCSPTNLCSPKLRFCSPTREIVQLCSQKNLRDGCRQTETTYRVSQKPGTLYFRNIDRIGSKFDTNKPLHTEHCDVICLNQI